MIQIPEIHHHRENRFVLTDEMKHAVDLINNDDKAIYITGEAGSGKTTLLRNLSRYTTMQFIVTASTGVAAVNAGGVTLHSLLNIPLGALNDKTPLGYLPENKRQLLCSADAIIIDEVSMIRPDIIDFVDRKLRSYLGRRDLPFGGLKIIMFGDMYQLPPVVRAEEAKVLKGEYEGFYFFDAKVFREEGFNVVKLTKKFRQTDTEFLKVLNDIRSYKLTKEDMELLGERRDIVKSACYDGNTLHICTHKKDAEAINSKMLGKATCSFKAEINKKFNPNAAPCDMQLKLREGARVMTLVNNPANGYFNGSRGEVVRIMTDRVIVKLDDGKQVEIEPYSWESVEYAVKDGVIQKNVIGTCRQYPLTLAWAITIHKSQGLTFDSVVIHAHRAFCPGQVYVALSRCRTLEGVTLDSFISPRQIIPDQRLMAFEKALEQSNGAVTKETYQFIKQWNINQITK